MAKSGCLKGYYCLVMTKKEYKAKPSEYKGMTKPETFPALGSVKSALYNGGAAGTCLAPVFYPDEFEKLGGIYDHADGAG